MGPPRRGTQQGVGSSLGRSMEKKMRLSQASNAMNADSDSDDGIDLVGRHAGRVSSCVLCGRESASKFSCLDPRREPERTRGQRVVRSSVGCVRKAVSGFDVK